MKKILVTSALPYANGSIHLGHLVEYIQTDIWVRMQRMLGHTCYYICADDTHGTPIMLKAQQEGIAPEALIARVHQEHQADFAAFQIGFDRYDSTHSDANRDFSALIYQRLRDKKLILEKEIEQFYDEIKELFLPDRFIKGECPKCHAKDQYGDSCEVCGTTYAPTDLINPYSAISGSTPVRRKSLHYFFNLPACADFLKAWTQQPGHLQPEAANKMREWLGSGLQAWDISRDAPYFGFEIPDAPGKYFYVWLDAPIGYIGSFKNFADYHATINFSEFWDAKSSAETELYHFIGKDILYFHALFWPAMLHHAEYRLPTQIFAHGFLTVNGEKMSKSRGTFITARKYIDCIGAPEYLRYYYAAKLNSTMEDIDLNLDDFMARVNSDVVGKFLNIVGRSSSFITKFFAGCWQPQPQSSLIHTLLAVQDAIAGDYLARETSRAIRQIMLLADAVNQYIDQQKPWVLAKDESQRLHLQQVCSTALHAFLILAIYLKPVLPEMVGQIEKQFDVSQPMRWADAARLEKLVGVDALMQPYQHLLKRLEVSQIQSLLAA